MPATAKNKKRRWSKIQSSDGLTYEKEALTVGELTKWVGDDKEERIVNVKKVFLDHLKATFDKMKKIGVRVPLFATHVEHPDNERGLVVGCRVGKNKEGKDALFPRVRFHDEEARDKGIKVDVSVGIPPKFKDGRGNVYHHPLRHLALTSKPVVPGLGPWEPLVLSFDTPDGLMLSEDDDEEFEMKTNPKITKLLKALKVDQENDLDDQLDEALESVKELSAAVGKKRKGKIKDEEVDEDENEEIDEDEDELVGAGSGKGGVEFSHSPVILKNLVRGREREVDLLLSEELINPVTAKKLKKQYCSKNALAADIEFSEDGDTEFDRAVSLIRSMKGGKQVLKKSGRETIHMSHGDDTADDEDDNPLIRDAKRRRAAASKSR